MNVLTQVDQASRNSAIHRKRILLGHLGKYGDCLFATAVARQIKADFPDCHLTWAIGSPYRSVIRLNPYVDDIWEIGLTGEGEIKAWAQFEQEAMKRKSRGDFDEVFFTQIMPRNVQNFDGTVRSSIFRNYPNRITVPVTPSLELSSIEIENVRRFAITHHLTEKRLVVLFECAAMSGQSYITRDFAFEVAKNILPIIPDSAVILSSKESFTMTDERIIDGSVLSFRENAELSKYCHLLVGCSSGISWLCTTKWAKPLPMIQLLSSDAFCFASFVYDHTQFGLPTDSIIEIPECTPDTVCRCILSVFSGGFEKARLQFHQRMKMPYGYYEPIHYQLLRDGKYKQAIHFLVVNLQRHGFHSQFIFWPFRRMVKKISQNF